jgi:hypothetical protein
LHHHFTIKLLKSTIANDAHVAIVKTLAEHADNAFSKATCPLHALFMRGRKQEHKKNTSAI